VAVTAGDPFAACALRVVERLTSEDRVEETITLEASTSPSSVGRLADSRATALIVVAAADAGQPERVGSTERVCNIAAATRHPILFVPASAPWPPRRAVLAVDFGRASLDAALVALGLLEAPAIAAPAFVDTGEGLAPSGDDGVPPAHLRLLFDALPSVLGAHAGVTLAPHFLKGPRVPTLIAFATAYGAELIAIGRQGRSVSGGLRAVPLGPTVRGLLAQAPCSLLVSSSA